MSFINNYNSKKLITSMLITTSILGASSNAFAVNGTSSSRQSSQAPVPYNSADMNTQPAAFMELNDQNNNNYEQKSLSTQEASSLFNLIPERVSYYNKNYGAPKISVQTNQNNEIVKLSTEGSSKEFRELIKESLISQNSNSLNSYELASQELNSSMQAQLIESSYLTTNVNQNESNEFSSITGPNEKETKTLEDEYDPIIAEAKFCNLNGEELHTPEPVTLTEFNNFVKKYEGKEYKGIEKEIENIETEGVPSISMFINDNDEVVDVQLEGQEYQYAKFMKELTLKYNNINTQDDKMPTEGQHTQEENEYEGLNLGAVGTETASDAEEQEEADEVGAQATNEQQEASEGEAGIAGAAAAGYEDGHETSGEDGHAASDSGIKSSGPSTKELLQEVGNFDDSVNDLLADRLRETGGARRALASRSQPGSGISTGSGLYPESNIWAKAFMRGSYIEKGPKRDSLLGGAIIGIDNEVTDDITGGVAFQIGGGKSNKAGEKDASLFAVGGLLYERANIGENLSNNLSFQFSRNSISPENAEASDGQVIWNFRPTLGFDYDYSYGDFDISGGLSLYGQSRIAEENSHKTALKLDLETSYNINSGDYNVKPYLAVSGEWSFWESNAKSDEQLPEASKISPVSDDSLVGGFSSGVKLDNDNYSLQLNYSYNKGWNKVFSSHTGAIKLSVKL